MRVVKAPLQGRKAHGAWKTNRCFVEVAGALRGDGHGAIATLSRLTQDVERVHRPAGGGA